MDGASVKPIIYRNTLYWIPCSFSPQSNGPLAPVKHTNLRAGRPVSITSKHACSSPRLSVGLPRVCCLYSKTCWSQLYLSSIEHLILNELTESECQDRDVAKVTDKVPYPLKLMFKVSLYSSECSFHYLIFCCFTFASYIIFWFIFITNNDLF